MPRPSTAITVLALAASTNAFLPLKARVNRLVKMQAEEKPHATVIFLRHGQSVWNEASLFTGWADVELTTLGKNEAAAGATSMWKEGFEFDVAYTSLLKRAQQTLDITLQIMGQEHVPVNQDWRLNERMYGGLTGLNKKETAEKYGPDQVKAWRRSYDVPPPPIDKASKYWPGNDNKYAHLPDEELPLSECLKDTVERCVPYWDESIASALKRGKTVLVAAHGNSIRGMIKVLDNIPDSTITEVEIPTAVPLVYHLDKNLKPIPSARAVAPLSGHFLLDPEALAAAQAAVAAQSVVAPAEAAPATAAGDIGRASAPTGWENISPGDAVQFACLGSGCLILATDDMKEAFAGAVVASDGQIRRGEFMAALKALDPAEGAFTEAGAEELFAMVDRDKNGAINFEEFVQAVTAERMD